MKKIIIFMIMVLVLSFSLAAKGFAEEFVPAKKIVPEVISETAGEPVPPPTLNEIKKVVHDEVRGEKKAIIAGIKNVVKEENDKFLKKADSETAKAIQSQSSQINGVNNKIDDLSRSLSSILMDQFKNVRYTAGVVSFVIGILIFLLFRDNSRGKKENKKLLVEVETNILGAVQRIEDKIEEIPERTAEKVKELERITITFETLGHRIEYKPQIINGSYLSLYVPKSQTEKCSDASRIIRIPIDHRGNLYKSSLEVMASYLKGEYDKDTDNIHFANQKAVIDLAQKNTELKITKI